MHDAYVTESRYCKLPRFKRQKEEFRINDDYNNLSYEIKNTNLSTKNILIVTQEYNGISKNGGVGTAYSSLAKLLHDNGHSVRVLFVPIVGNILPNQEKPDKLNVDGVEISILHSEYDIELNIPSHRTFSYLIFKWIEKQKSEYDIIHFPDWLGLAFYSLTAKRQGFVLPDTEVVIGMHGPTAWAQSGNAALMPSPEMLEIDFMERESVRMADAIISPSQYMLEWLEENKWHLPDRILCEKNVVNTVVKDCNSEDMQKNLITEFVFFGRIEERKGFRLFCQALSRTSLVSDPSITVTFLGRPTMVDGVSSSQIIEGLTAKWACKVVQIKNFDTQQAMEYVSAPGRAVVIPSVSENSPYTVVECIALGVPFIAAGVGGIPELLHSDDRSAHCFRPNASELAEKITRVAVDGLGSARFSTPPGEIDRSWLQWHANDHGFSPSKREKLPLPKVSVCVVHYNRPQFLMHAIESLRNQDYANYEVILIDCSSTLPEARGYIVSLEDEFNERGWKIIIDDDLYLGAARNAVAKSATGEYIIFMDDDNIAKNNQISMFVRAALCSKADVLTCASSIFSGENESPVNDEKIWVPLGASLATGIYSNCFGDANSMVRREVFDAVGGFTELVGVGHDDWEFFARATLAGFRVETVPYPLFWYRLSSSAMSLQVNNSLPSYKRSIGPYVEKMQNGIGLALEYGLKLHLVSEQKRRHRSGLKSNMSERVKPVSFQEIEFINKCFANNENMHKVMYWIDTRIVFSDQIDFSGDEIRCCVVISGEEYISLRFAFLCGDGVDEEESDLEANILEFHSTFPPGISIVEIDASEMHQLRGDPSIRQVKAVYFGGVGASSVKGFSIAHEGRDGQGKRFFSAFNLPASKRSRFGSVLDRGFRYLSRMLLKRRENRARRAS